MLGIPGLQACNAGLIPRTYKLFVLFISSAAFFFSLEIPDFFFFILISGLI